jgi:hypothetical protein
MRKETLDLQSKLSENFYAYEFVCRGSGKLQLHPGLIDEAQILRNEVYTETSQGIIVLSGCRSFEYNQLIKGHERSLHICDRVIHPGQQGTLGFDVAAVDPFYRGWLFSIAWRRGWSIGWNAARRFLHLDRRDWVGLRQSSFDY